MSWRLILSEYPESLFRDSSALLALAMLERSGAQTEDELAHHTKAERPLLARALLALHRDRCVEYTRDFVRVTERGRDFIDRLALQDEIVDDLLNNMRIPAAEQPPIRAVFLKYRSRSFPRYLDSVTAIRTWHKACQASFLAAGQERSARESGALAILLRDLRKWFVASGEIFDEPDTNKTSDAAQRMLILGQGGAGKTALALRALRDARRWLDTYDDLGRADNPWENLRSLESPYLVVFFAHEYSRDLEDLNTWVHNWTAPKGKWLVVLNACRSAGEFITRPNFFGGSNLTYW